MTLTRKKPGRKSHDWLNTLTGCTINGLYRKPQTNVWRMRSTGQEFTEASEQRAIDRFYALSGEHEPLPIPAQSDFEQDGESGRLFLRSTVFDTPELWAYVAKELLERPRWVAEKTGVVWVGWREHNRPVPSPRLVDVLKHYVGKVGLSHDEAGRAAKHWAEFVKVTGAETLDEITHDAVSKYELKLAGDGLAPKTIKHKYSIVKTTIAHAMRRGVDPKSCRTALDVLAMLQMPNATPLAPHPISIPHFWQIHAAAMAANDASFAAMLLVAANACMYPGEVSVLRWNEVNLSNGEVVTRRPKTGVARVAILWKETLVAIKELPHHSDDFIFFSERRTYTTNLVSRHFANYRAIAGLPDSIKFGDIRDASYTIACRNCTLDKAKILAGHRLSGASDHYVQRNPGFVKAAILAIHDVFFPVA